MAYSLYAEACNATKLCDNSKSLSCLSANSNCNCPTALTTGTCDCPTTHYSDGTTCVARVSINGVCTVGKNYMCNYFNF